MITILHGEGGGYQDPQKWLRNIWMTPKRYLHRSLYLCQRVLTVKSTTAQVVLRDHTPYWHVEGEISIIEHKPESVWLQFSSPRQIALIPEFSQISATFSPNGRSNGTPYGTFTWNFGSIDRSQKKWNNDEIQIMSAAFSRNQQLSAAILVSNYLIDEVISLR